MGSYSCNALMADEETCDSLKGRNMICFCAQDREGRSVDTLIIFSDAHSAVTLSLPTDQGLFDFARRIVAQRRYAPVVSCYEPFEGPVTFVDQMRFCTEMERDANWALVTPYLCINAVPTHIVRSALTDGGVLHSFPQLDERRVRVYLEEFLYFHSLRYKALFSSAHLRGHIASRQSMRRFALTGMLDDEYLPVRPLTTQERLAVLQGLLDLMRNDERFVLRFRRNESNLGIRAYCFSETGVLTHPIKTISSLYMNYRASIIRHPRLVELFEECFWDDLLRNHALSREESVAYLEGLVRELREGA